ncbi:MAG TPA: DnaA regulatory inactivator Hda [Candidatus Aphodousia gallistercoris]|nr:DnaA regulatory inactivator Hda [Candidatus Aphodousia gallistercoris]
MLFEQLPLDIAMEPPATLETFVAGDNAEALACLQRMQQNSDPQLAYLWGESGVGKTHLAVAMGLIDDDVPDFDPERLRYAVDDVDTLSESGLDRLFALINEVRLHPQCTLVMTGKKSPAEEFVRPDIRTRLAWGAVFHIKPLNAEIWPVLLKQAAERGISVTPEAEQWMRNYLPRDIKTLSHVLSAMDRELLAKKRAAVTVPLLKKWLQKKASQPETA